MRALSRSASLVVALLVCTAGFETAAAQPNPSDPDPRERFTAGVSAFSAGQFADALDAFRDAYRLRPHPTVLVNIANCYLNLDRPLDAAQYFERYLRDAGSGIAPAARQEVEVALARARVAIARLSVVAPEGTEVFIDGDRVDRTPLARPIELNPGPHVLELRLPGGATRSRRIQIRRGAAEEIVIQGGDSAELVVRESESPPESEANAPPLIDPAPIVPEVSDSRGGSRPPLAAWITGGVAVAALAVGAGFGIKALRQRDSYDALLAELSVTDPSSSRYDVLQLDGQSIHDTRKSNALIADIALFVGLAGAGVATYLFIRGARPESDGLRVNAGLTPSSAAISVEGGF